MRRLFVSALAAVAISAGTTVAPASASEKAHLDQQHWSWQGMFGTYDQAQLRRGWQVFKDICSGCHSMKLVAYRNLSALGFKEDEIKALAREKEVQDGPNDQGDMFTRFARPSDRIVPPFPNDNAARVANNGALPPDLSLITKARTGGPDYVYSLLIGYADPPGDVSLMPGMNYNKVFPGHQIGMPPPIADGAVTYTDGTTATTQQIAKDITAFLNWAAEPEMDDRHSMGVKTLAFLVLLTGLFYALKRQIWSDVH